MLGNVGLDAQAPFYISLARVWQEIIVTLGLGLGIRNASLATFGARLHEKFIATTIIRREVCAFMAFAKAFQPTRNTLFVFTCFGWWG